MTNLNRKLIILILVLLAVSVPQRAVADEDDPSGRAARLAYAKGSVSFQPAGTDDWVAAVVNRPITTGDKLWTDRNSRAELHIGSATIRLADQTGFSFLDLGDNLAQIDLSAGVMSIHLRHLDQNEAVEVDTPNLAFSLLRPGDYRLEVNEAGDTTVVAVRSGEGEVTGGGQAVTIHSNQRATFTGTDQLASDVDHPGGYDDFDRWCRDRDHREEHAPSARYVSRDVIGYQDLDDYGDWRTVPEYGPIWVPRRVVVGWAPYRYGHWVWISPWGWTWVDDAPWGFAPFHYGRWAFVGGVWGWCPGPVVAVRPVYAPALVAWIGGPHFSIGIGIVSVGAGVGWFPLGPREVYVPPYQVSRTYVNNVNVTNTTINNTYVTNVYNNTVNNNVTNIKYVNRTAPGAVTAISQTAFTSGQPVHRNIVRVDQKQLAQAHVVNHTDVVPQQRSVLGAAAPARVKPPVAVQARSVVARRDPPPPPASFASQQKAIQSNGGRPLGTQEARHLETQSRATAAPVRVVEPAARPVPVENVASARSGQPVQLDRTSPHARSAPNRTVQQSPQSQKASQSQLGIRDDRPPSAQSNRTQPTRNLDGNRPGNAYPSRTDPTPHGRSNTTVQQVPQSQQASQSPLGIGDDRPPSAQPDRTQPARNLDGNRPNNAYPSRTDRPMTNTHDGELERGHQQERQSWQQQQQRPSLEQKNDQQTVRTQRQVESQHQEREIQQGQKHERQQKEEQRHSRCEDRLSGR
jgi:hypothetical protein